MTTPHDARLVPAAAAAWAASAAATFGMGALAVVVSVLMAVGAACSRRARASFALAALASAVAAAVASLAVGAEGPVRALVNGPAVDLVGVVADDPAPVRAVIGRVRVSVAVRSVCAATCAGARGTVVVVAGEQWSSLRRGDTITARGRLSPASAPQTALMWSADLVEARPREGVDDVVATVRDGLRAATHVVPPPVRGLVVGMTIGDTSLMPTAQRDQMSLVGLAHLTAVSGTHFAIVLASIALVLRAVVRPRVARAAALVVAMMAFAALVFPHASVARALGMALVVATAVAWGRPAQALPALAAATFGVALVAPALVVEAGFVMSVAAVAAIVLWAPHVRERLAPVAPPMVAGLVAVSACAQAVVWPVLVAIGAETGLYSVLANVLVAWCAVPVTLLGLASAVVAVFWMGGAEVLAGAAGLAAQPVALAARFLSEAPGSRLAWPAGVAGVVAAGAVVSLLVVGTVTRRMRGWVTTAVAVGAFAVATVGPSIHAVIVLPSPVRDWRIVACDVGQGDAMLVRSGANRAIMIDTGPPGGAAADCLVRYGVHDVDLLVVTHAHADHNGSVADVLRRATVHAAWVPRLPDQVEDETSAVLAGAGVPTSSVSAGATMRIGGVSIRVLSPTAPRRPGSDTDINDASIATAIAVDGIAILALADLEHAGQAALARTMAPVVVDVVKVAHHGSARQDPALAARVSARIAIVSVGADNPYGHPAAAALTLYSTRASVVARTDECGDVVIVRRSTIGVISRCRATMAG